MLARVADALYWMGRYIERAENVSRLLMVTSELAVEFEGLDDELAQAEWDALLRALPGCQRAQLDFSPTSGLSVPYVKALLLDDANPVSVRHSIARARENARGIREALTREVFLNLNEAHRDLDRAARRGVSDSTAGLELVYQAHKSILTTLGAVEHTLSRDQGWTFMKLGEASERTVRSLLILRAKLPAVEQEARVVDLPLVYAHWRSLLRCVASLENFRRVHGAGLDPEDVVRFLLFDRFAPRSVRCGLARMKGYLEQLPRAAELSTADRVLGKLLAQIDYEDERILEKANLNHFIDETVQQLHEAHEAVCKQYFLS